MVSYPYGIRIARCFDHFFEIITVLLRLGLKLESKVLQEECIRIHHGYIGMGFLVLSLFSPLSALWVIGWALILSDLVHHYTVLPLLSITEVDIAMEHYGVTKQSIARKLIIAVAAVFVVGVLASAATSLWVGGIALIMIAVSEKLEEVLPRFKVPQEVTIHF